MDKILSIAFKDVIKRPTSLYIILVISLIISLLNITAGVSFKVKEQMLNILSKINYTLSIYPKNFVPGSVKYIGYIEIKSINDTTVDYKKEAYLSEEQVRKIINILKKYDRDAILLPRLYLKIDVIHKGKNINLTIAGVKFKEEKEARHFLKLYEGNIPSEVNGAIIGAVIAKSRGIKVGDNPLIANKSFKVYGIYEYTGTLDDFLVFVNLNVLQSIFNMNNKISLINISSKKLDKSPLLIEKVASHIDSEVPNIKTIIPKQFMELKIKFINKVLSITTVAYVILIPLWLVFLYVSIYLDLISKERLINILNTFYAKKVNIKKFLLTQHAMIVIIPMPLVLIFSSIGKILVMNYLLNIDIFQVDTFDLKLTLIFSSLSLLIIFLATLLIPEVKKEVKFYG